MGKRSKCDLRTIFKSGIKRSDTFYIDAIYTY